MNKRINDARQTVAGVPTTTTQPTMSQGSWELDTSKEAYLPAFMKKQGEPEMKEDNEFLRAIRNQPTPEEQAQAQKRLQQRMDEYDYAKATDKQLRNTGKYFSWEAPTVARDENGEMILGEDGKPLVGRTTDEARVGTHQQVAEEQAEWDNLTEQEKRERLKDLQLQDEELDYKEPNTLESLGKKLGAGVINLGAGFLKMMEELSSGMIVEDASSPTGYTRTPDFDPNSDDPMTSGIRNMGEYAERLSREGDARKGKSFTDLIVSGDLTGVLQKGMGVAAESAPMMLSTFNPYTMIANAISMAGNNYWQETMENPEIPAYKRAMYAAGTAAIEQLVEKYAEPVFKYTGGIGKKATKEAVQKATKEARETIAKRITNVLKDASGEGIEEVVTNFGNDALGSALDMMDKESNYGIVAQWEELKKKNPNATIGDFALQKADEVMNAYLGGALAGAYTSSSMQASVAGLRYALGGNVSAEDIAKNPRTINPIEMDVAQTYDKGHALETPEEKQDAKMNLDDKADALLQFADESTLNALDEDGIGTLKEIMARDDWSDEQKQAALDYVNAKATYEGMIDRVKDDIETEVADSDAAIDRRVASQEQGGDGMIHPATMAKDNRQVDIISGNVVMSDDGSMVDTQKSDKDIIVRDRQTGKVEFANPKEIKSVEAPIDAEALKASERERITNEKAQAASNAIDGVLPMQQGDQYTLTYNGEQHQVQVVQDNGDGTVSVIIDGAKEPQDMAKEQLQDLANQSNRARLEQSRQQAQQQAPVEETPTETPTTTAAEIQEATPEEAPTEAAPEEAPKLEGNGLRKDMPMREDGNPAFMEVTPERTQQFLYGEESGMTEDEATQFVDKNIAAAEKALEEVKKGAPEVGTDFAKFKAEKAAYQQQLDAAQAAVDYWNNVKAARQAAMAAPVAQQAPVEQNAPEAVQPSEVESNATPIETTQETAPEASVESAEEKPTTRLKGSGLKSEEQIAEEQKKKEEQKAAEKKKEEEKKAKRQEKFRKRAESWSKKTGVKVNIIDNVDDVENAEAKAAIKKGRKVKGWWQQSNNEIYIYLPNMESMDDVDETFIHEAVAHRGLRHLLGEEEFGKLCDKVFEAMSPKAKARELKYVGVSEKDIKEGKYTDKQKRAAADEYMAKMSEHTDLNPTLWEQICNWIREALGRTIDVDKVKMSNESIQRLIRASYAHYQAEAKKAAAENLEEQGMAVDTERGDVRFAVADVLKGDDIDKVTKELMDVTGRSESTVKKWLKAEQSLAKIILDDDNVAFLDLQVDESVPSIWNNADYPQGTVEFSNICRKRLPLTMIYQKLQKEFPNLVFDAKTLESIRGILKENGVDVACGLCFVEDRRQLLGEIGKGFIDMLQGKNNFVNDNQNKALNKLRESGDEYVPNLYELLTLDGMKKLRREHPSVAQAFIEYNNARGMQAGRLFQAYSAYHREILKYNKAKVRSINNNGGLRIFSFSDFEAHHLIDLVQVLTDCAAKGIKVQGYTKVPEFANAVKDTGMKLNRSLIAKGKGYVDEDYVPADNEAVSPNVINGKRLLLDCVEGIDVNHPDFFDSTDNKNVGNILVGINDEQIHMAMEDPFVDYIIPFHTGLSKDILKQKNIGEWVNYKLMQLEKVDNGRGGLTNAPHHGINIYTDVLPRGEELIGHPIKNARDFQMAFFKACEEKGFVPRFEKFINRGKNGEYVYTKGYEKLLLDFKLFDKNGKIVPQEAVVPVFDDKVNKRILEDYVKGEKEKAPNDKLYDKVKEGLGLDGDVRFREGDRESR